MYEPNSEIVALSKNKDERQKAYSIAISTTLSLQKPKLWNMVLLEDEKVPELK